MGCALHHSSSRVRTRRGAEFDEDQQAVVQMLLDGKAFIEAKDVNGCTPLMFAVSSGDEAVAKCLLDSRANAAAEDNEGQTSLDYANRFELAELAQLLTTARAEQDRDRAAGTYSPVEAPKVQVERSAAPAPRTLWRPPSPRATTLTMWRS